MLAFLSVNFELDLFVLDLFPPQKAATVQSFEGFLEPRGVVQARAPAKLIDGKFSPVQRQEIDDFPFAHLEAFKGRLELRRRLQTGDVLLTIGAGDIRRILDGLFPAGNKKVSRRACAA